MITIDLTSKTALVTGGGQGLGAETVRTLHAAGANVALNFFPDAAGINRNKAEALAGELGPRTWPVAADVRSHDEARRMMEQTKGHFGRLDIVINNAGIVRDRTLAKMTSEEWRDVIDTNLTGVFHVCQAASAVLENDGCIVNLSSLSASVGLFGQANYAAAKAGLMGFTKTLSREFGKRGIRVNAVAPGLVLTEMGQTVPENQREQWLAQIPLQRLGRPSDISGAILFLCIPTRALIRRPCLISIIRAISTWRLWARRKSRPMGTST